MSGERECGVCWYVYRPDDGGDVWQVRAGTAFDALPDEWRCPRCDSGKERFLPLTPAPPSDERGRGPTLAARVSALVADYQRFAATTMKELPFNNPRLTLEAVDFEPLGDGALGALVTPWALNLVYLPPPGAPKPTARGHEHALPAAVITFFPQALPTAGDVELASLFSPAQQFEDQAAAVATAREALAQLRAPPVPPAPGAHSRRELLDTLRGRRRAGLP
ncbi:MAG: [NiFe]-hydrogenase assembly chaperone HybE [Myxococcota bacterium]|jgi:[NiFe] hydrogenase assembly HybE family chaperone